jgi:superfamily II DNA or RNA helicase
MNKLLQYRPYQADARDASIDAASRGVTRQLLCLPTGTGKTPLLAGMRSWHQIRNRQMVLVHREELATQAKDKILQWNPTLRVGIEMADSYANDNDDVVIASVPTIGRVGSKRLSKFVPNEFGLITIDEAHHSTASSYQTIFRHMGCLDDLSNKLLIGVTATPNRADNQGLGQVFDEIPYQYSILDAIRDGYLVDIRGIKISAPYVSLDSVGVLAGDFVQGDLARTVNTPRRNADIVARWKFVAKKDTGYRQTVAFCVDVQHAKDLDAKFTKQGIKAAAIWASDPDRAEKLRAHRQGDIQVITNVGILTEGYDDWRIECIIMARPTKSSLLFTQMVGRGTRIPDGISNLKLAIRQGLVLLKKDCIVLDVVDATSKHSLVTLASLFGLAPKADLDGKTITEALEIVEQVKSKRPEIILDEMKNINQLTNEQVDLFKDKTPVEVEQNTKLKWNKVSDTEYRIQLPMGESVRVFKDVLDKWEIKGVVCGTGFKQQGLNNLPEAFRVADNFLQMFGKGLLTLLRRNPVVTKPKPIKLSPSASDAQKKYIAVLYKDNAKVMAGINSLSTKEASRLIAQHKVTPWKAA